MEPKSTFIKVDRFDSAVAALSAVKRKLDDARAMLEKISMLKIQEDTALAKWSADISAVQTKIESIESELMHEE